MSSSHMCAHDLSKLFIALINVINTLFTIGELLYMKRVCSLVALRGERESGEASAGE